jgi:flagellar basal-body rod modification protein FlgD
MTGLNGINAGTGAAQSMSAPGGSASSVDYGAFLRLLVAQLKNQDPTKPMDSTQYMAQLASFSQVEQSIMANAKLDALLTSVAIAQSESVIGRTVTSGDGTITGVVVSVRITSAGPLAKLEDGTELLIGPGVEIS